MKKTAKRLFDRVSPRQQHNWDGRAATNFIAGGAGGGLLLLTAVAGLDANAARAAILTGLVLIASGLTCVWFEIGRPWRALNVYRHFATSWMTREAVAALFLFPIGGLALLTGRTLFVALAGILGLAFLYCQARMLAANKGIPTWRHQRSVPLMVSTGLAEGAGFLAAVSAILSPAPSVWVLAGLIAALVVRAFFWKTYLVGLVAEGAPEGALRVLLGIDRRIVIIGHSLPLLAIVAVLVGMPGRVVLVLAAGILAVAGGWFLKYALSRRAAFTQGLALPRLPVRGGGPPGPAAKPGWRFAPGAKAG